MHQRKSKRAFTLIEMVIAIVVIAVVFSMVTIMSVSISGYSKEKTLITERHEEITRAQTFLKNWSKTLDDAFNTKFQLRGTNHVYIQSGLFYDKNPDNEFGLTFDHAHKKLTGIFYINHTEVPRVEAFKHIEDMKFTLGTTGSVIDNTLKCEITMDDNSKYVILLEKESSKHGLSVIFNGPFEKKDGSNNEFVFITSSDWDNDLSQVANKDLFEIFNEASSDYSAAYHYAAMSMLRIQVDQGARMSLEAFATAYEATWKVSLFNAAGKIAYRMTLPDNANFRPSEHRLSFFIEEGSVLFDGTPVDAMGYTRKEGGMGTTDWHDAAELTFVKQSTSGTVWWLEFDTNIQWDEMDATKYTDLQYSTVRKLYGMSNAFGLGIDDGIFITIDDVRTPLSTYANKNKIKVEMTNQGERGNVRIRLGLDDLVSSGKTAAITFTTKFHLPDGTPLREENTFLCKSAKGSLNKAVPITAAGEELKDGMFYMYFYVNTPWTDTKTTKYLNIEKGDSDFSGFKKDNPNHSLGDDDNKVKEILGYFYDRIFIGKDGAEKPLRIAMKEYKLNITLARYDEDRMLLTFAVKEADYKAAGYPFNFEDNTFSIRFGANSLQSSDLITKFFILPNGTPVRFGSLARIKGEMGNAHWLARQTMSLPTAPIGVNKTLTITISTNAPWLYQSGQTFKNILDTSGNHGFPPSFVQSLKSKVELTIGSKKQTLAGWGTSDVDVNVLQQNGCMAMQIVIKNDKASGKTVKLEFLNGFVGPDGTTLAVPAKFEGSGNGGEGWSSETNGNLFFAKRTMSIVSSGSGTQTVTVTLKTAALNGSGHNIYFRVKLENAKSLGSGAATIKFDFASSADKTITLYSDTGDWIKLTDLNEGSVVSMGKENVTITFQMYNMSGTLTIADLIVADKSGNIKYSMANDTTLYGVGDVRNVSNVNSSKSSWSATTSDSKANFPIITRGDANYLPNRILTVTSTSSASGKYATVLIDPKKFSQGVTYYVTGRLRANLTNAPASGTNIVVSGAGTEQKYGVQNGEWVALAQPNGDPLTFTGGFEEVPATTLADSDVHRSIGISCSNNTRNAKLVIDKDQFVARHGSGTFVVHGYYKITDYRANDFVSDDSYTIGGNAEGAINKKGIQGTWTYFRVVWNTSKNLDFQFWHATGGLYLANLTIEDTNHNRKYDMAMDTELEEGYKPINQPSVDAIRMGVWYIYPFPEKNEHSDVTMDVSVGAVKTSSTPQQYTISSITKIDTIANGADHRTLGMSCKNNARNAKVVIDNTKFNTKFGAGTYTVRGYYKITDFRANDGVSDASYTIGGNATGAIKSSGIQATWKYFEVTWNSANSNLDFQFWHATGGLYIANLTIENSNRDVIYDMAMDDELTEGYKTVTMPNPEPIRQGIWYVYAFPENGDHCSITMDVLIGAAKSTATPKQYTVKTEKVPIETVSSVKRDIGMASSGQTINAKMMIYGSKFAAAKGAGTYTVRGYYKITNYTSLGSGNHISIGTGASSGTVAKSASVGSWTRFTLTWNTNNNLLFEFWMATGGLYIGNLTIENSSGTIVYDMSTDTAVPSGYHTAFPIESGYWYFGYSTNTAYPTANVNISNGNATTQSPAWYTTKETVTKISTISSEHRKISIGAKNNLTNAKMVLLAKEFNTKFGAADYTVRGYYKVENYKANDGAGSDHYYTIGANATSGSVKKTGNQTSWTYFELKWNPNSGKDLDFQFWNATGYIHIANLTVEKSNRSLVYDMGTDTNLPNVWWNTEEHNFPQYTGTGDIWYFNPYGINQADDRVVMNISPTAVKTTHTPKQYTENLTINQKLSTVHRQMGIGARNNLLNAKMVLQADKFKTAFGAADYTIRGYYKVLYYKANDGVTSGHYYTVGANATSGAVQLSGNQTDWKYFELKWNPNSGKNLDFQFYKATGTLYIANLTVEKADRTVVYDMAKDSALKEMWLSTNHNAFPQYSGKGDIWYFNPYGIKDTDKTIMNVSPSAVKTTRTPEQYDLDKGWKYIKFALGNNGTMEIADLQIYYLTSSNGKQYVYTMKDDPAMATSKNNVNNTNNFIGNTLWPYTWDSISFKYSITNNNITTPPDGDFVVPKFTETAG